MERKRVIRLPSVEDAFKDQAIRGGAAGGGTARGGSDDFLSLLDTAETGQEATNEKVSNEEANNVMAPLLEPSSEAPVAPAPVVQVIQVVDEKLVDQRAKLAISFSGMKCGLIFYVVMVNLLAVMIFFELGKLSLLATIVVGSAGVLLLLATVTAVCTRKKRPVIVAVVTACLACVAVLFACAYNLFILIRSGSALSWSVGQGIGEIYTVYANSNTNIMPDVGDIKKQLNNAIGQGGNIEDFLKGRQITGTPAANADGVLKSAHTASIDAGSSSEVADYQDALLSVHGLAALGFAANDAASESIDAENESELHPGIGRQARSTAGPLVVPGIIAGLRATPTANDWLAGHEFTGQRHAGIKNTCHNDYWNTTTTYRKGVNIASQAMARAGLFCTFSHLSIFEFQRWPVDCATDCGFGDDPEKFIGSQSHASRYEAALAAQQRGEKGKFDFSDPNETVKMCAMLQTATACSIWNLGYFLILPVLSAVWLLLCICSFGACIPSVYNGYRVIKNM
ncbi:putative transmembrane protein [Toxoplasma gondii MAS]|uniref:Putative transmembrane protein n=1 Tax=Toxoplasma gondii MAS TaxID=943118 RepID=A0A086QMY7_TOXGO|nr:putative transmembrane protein [Toxoplasma gondii MAS]